MKYVRLVQPHSGHVAFSPARVAAIYLVSGVLPDGQTNDRLIIRLLNDGAVAVGISNHPRQQQLLPSLGVASHADVH